MIIVEWYVRIVNYLNFYDVIIFYYNIDGVMGWCIVVVDEGYFMNDELLMRVVVFFSCLIRVWINLRLGKLGIYYN